MAGVTAVELSCAELSVREVNAALRELPDGSAIRITEPRGRHNLAVGLTGRLDITIEGNAGYFVAGLCDGPNVDVEGFVGWSVGEAGALAPVGSWPGLPVTAAGMAVS